MSLSDNRRLIALRVTLGPVLEEVVFRSYLFAFLTWLWPGWLTTLSYGARRVLGRVDLLVV